jgi:antitoxin (DNA-binding transcriptional repressor) of toxin-antitoxin stability system
MQLSGETAGETVNLQRHRAPAAMLAGIGGYVTNDALTKYASESLPVHQILLVRGVVALGVLLPVRTRSPRKSAAKSVVTVRTRSSRPCATPDSSSRRRSGGPCGTRCPTPWPSAAWC